MDHDEERIKVSFHTILTLWFNGAVAFDSYDATQNISSHRRLNIMTRTEKMPNWVYWALWGIKSRVMAMAFLVFSGIVALVIVPEALMMGQFSALAFAPVPVWYWLAIEWMDENSTWEQ